MEKFGLASVLDMAAFDKGMGQYMSGIDQMEGKTEKAAGGLSKAMSGIGKAALGVGVAAGTMAVGVGAAVLAMGNEFDAAYDNIAIGTGATGAALDELKTVLHDTMSAIPTDAAAASSAIAELNKRLGLTGPELTNLAKPLLEASRLLGGDATKSASLFTRVMGDWGIPVEDANQALDKFFKASQLTGVGMDDLMTKVVQFGAPLRLMGFDIDDAAAMFAKWEKEGVNAELVMGSLRIAAGKFAKDNIPLQEGLQDTIKSIQGMENASDALALGMEIFGARAGPDMVASIREGRFEFQDLLTAVQASEGAIMDTASATNDFGEKLTILKNKAKVAVAPLGIMMVDAITKIVDLVSPLAEKLLPHMISGLMQLGSIAGNAMRALGSAVGGVLPFLEPLWEIAKGLFFGEGVNADWLAEIFTNIGIPAGIGDSIAQVVSIVGNAVAQIRPLFSTLLGQVMPAIASFGDQFMSVFKNIGALVQGVMPAIQVVIGAALGMIMSHWQTVFPAMLAIFQTVWSNVQNVIQAAIPVIVGLVTMLAPIIAQAMAFVSKVIGEVVAFVTPLIQQMVEFATAQFQVVLAWVTENMPLIKQTIETILHAIEAVWNAVWPVIQQVVVTVFETLKPVIAGAMAFILGTIKAIMQVINGDWKGAWESVNKAAEAIWLGLIEGVKNLLNGIIGIFVGAKGDFIAQGIAIIEGVMDGVRQKASDMINMVKGYVSDAIEAAKNVLGIHSPSAVFANIGLETMLGLAEGIDEGKLDVVSRITGVIKDVIGIMRDLPRIAIDAMPDADAFATIGATLKTSFTNIIEILEELWPWMQSRGIAPDVMQTRAGQLSAIISALTSINFGNIADAKVPSGEQWAKYFYAIQHIGGGIYDLVSKFSAEVVRTLPLASAAAQDVAGLFAVLSFDPSVVAEAKIPTGKQWEAYFKALRHMGGTIYNLIRDTSLDIADSVKKAGDVAESIEKLFGLVTIDFSGITDAKLPTWSQWSAYFQALSKIGGRIYDHIMRTSIDLAPSIAAAAEVSADIKTLFDLVGVDFSKIIDSPTITDAQLGAWGDSMIATVTEVARAVTAIETQIGDAALDAAVNAASRVAELASAAASISGSLTSVWEEGGIDVGMLAEIYTQMRQTVNAVQQLGEGSLLPPGFEVRTYSPPGDPAPGVAAQLTTVRIIGEFSVNGVEVADFAQDYELGSEIDIKLGTQAGRF